MSGWFYLSTERMTVAVYVSDGLVQSAAPIVAKFIGQPPGNLGRWMRSQPGFNVERLP